MTEDGIITCLRCGASTENMEANYQPVVLREMGNMKMIFCRTCGNQWLERKEEMHENRQ